MVLPLDRFGRNAAASNGRASSCKPCHNARGRKSKDLVGGERTYHLRRRHGITAEDADALLGEQDGMCAICRAAPAAHVDHDHETGRVRALLCSTCNGGLGRSRDDPGLLHLAAFSVERHRERQVLDLVQRAAPGPEGASRPGEPPVGSQRRPGGARGTRSAGRTDGERRQGAAGEVDG